MIINAVAGLLFCASIYMLVTHKKEIATLKAEYEHRIAELEQRLATVETTASVPPMADSHDVSAKDKAYNVLCSSYTKILRVNLTEDSFVIIHSLDEELDASKGYSDSITIWLREFARSGMVHMDDVTTYLRETDGDYLRKYFKRGMISHTVHYRRKFNDKYKKVKMELIRSEDYTDNTQIVYLYVKDIE